MTAHSVSVAGVVIDQHGQVLAIQRRDNGHWQPPGGVLELGETFEEGVRREVREETGVEITVGSLSGVYKNMNQGVVALVFRCTIERGQAQTSNEAADVRWLSSDQVTEMMTPAFAVRIHDALGSGTTTRAHDGANLRPA